jgi:hypothetical protein
MDARIELAGPELVAMRPEEHREAVRLLAALLSDVRSAPPQDAAVDPDGGSVTMAEALPLAPSPNGKAGTRKERGGPP